jgi:hypothetical protein
LKSQQNDDGVWRTGHDLGATALATLALLESEVPKNDPAVQRAVGQVRSQVGTNQHTYTVALCIMLLDRVGDRRDRDLIQSLGTRLRDGQLGNGDWTYTVPLAQTGAPNRVLITGRGDNSNTQFAVLGLWIARRHGVAVDDQLQRCGRFFENTFHQNSGGWGYTANSSATPAMTCAGLIALAAAHGSQTSLRAGVGAEGIKAAIKPDARPAAGPRVGDRNDDARANPNLLRDPKVQSALRYLKGTLQGNAGLQLGDLYYLWSIERVGVIYGMPKIGAVDWYAVGSDHAVRNQRADGSWHRNWGSVPETSFVLLFLNRSNFAPDLTQLVGGPSTLTAGTDIRDLQQLATAAGARQMEREAALTGAAKLLEDLKKADNDQQRRGILDQLRDAKGAEYSDALATAIDAVPENIKPQARDALADRLQRMTANTLRAKLASDESETRVAAVRAAGRKQLRELAPELIQLLLDRQPAVRQAAHQALVSLTGEDFGPAAGASTAESFVAKKRWEKWLSEQR